MHYSLEAIVQICAINFNIILYSIYNHLKWVLSTKMFKKCLKYTNKDTLIYIGIYTGTHNFYKFYGYYEAKRYSYKNCP